MYEFIAGGAGVDVGDEEVRMDPAVYPRDHTNYSNNAFSLARNKIFRKYFKNKKCNHDTQVTTDNDIGWKMLQINK